MIILKTASPLLFPGMSRDSSDRKNFIFKHKSTLDIVLRKGSRNRNLKKMNLKYEKKTALPKKVLS